MSSSTQLNLQHDAVKHPVVAGIVVLVVICVGVVVFNSLADAESRPADSEASNDSSESLNVNLHSSSSISSNSATDESSTSLTVNGQDVPVDQSGSIRKSFVSDNGNSSVNISIDNHSSNGEDSR